MKKCILYIIAGLSMIFLPGCFGAYGVITPHRVVYTSPVYVPRARVYHPRHHYKRRIIRHHQHRQYRHHRTIVRPRIRHRHIYKRNVYNRTTIHRHYYDNNVKNRRKGKKSKRGKKRR